MSSYLQIKNSSDVCLDFPADPAQTYSHPLDPFQQHAIAAISGGANVLVTAKTGSGKTLVGEYQIAHSLRKGGRVFYTTPIKSLSNQKFYDLKKMFPDRVGIMTGDIKYKPDADVVIMTTEILRNLLFKRGTATESLGITAALSLDRLDAVVFDECHYINDRDRGAVWEETMILLNPSVQLVLLSATVDAPQHFAAWLGELKQRPIHLISTDYRVVPLFHGVYKDKDFQVIMDRKNAFSDVPYKAWLQWRNSQLKAADQHKDAVKARARAGYDGGPIARTGGPKAFAHEMNGMIALLEEKQQLPALFFVFSRKDCERYADLTEHTLIDSSETAAVRHIMDFHLHSYGEELKRIPEYHTIRALLEKGIAYHHSGLIPILKECVEILFGRGLVKVLFATETFAVGINMPTKTVVFTGFRKYDDVSDRMRILNTDEYIQMAGRAGRRGKDDRGYVVYLPDREPETLEAIRSMMTGRSSTFQSRMTFHYDFILKTFQAGTLRWMDLLRSSYWNVGHTQTCREYETVIRNERLTAESITLSDAERAAMAEYETIQEAIRGSVNATRRAEQRRLEAWKNVHIGPRWYKVTTELWPQYQKSLQRIGLMERDLAATCDPEKVIQPSLAALSELGFLTAADQGELKLTPLGVMATEVNEGHPILMSLAYMNPNIRALLKTPEDVITFLAVFLGERENAPGGGDVSPAVRGAIRILSEIAVSCKETERRVGASAATPYNFWDLKTEFVEIVWRFVNGEELAVLLRDYELFGGNLMRILSKMLNILREWKVLATLSADVETLEKLSGAEEMLAVGTMGSESLYLRLA